MKKMRKGKKLLLILLIAIAITMLVVFIVNIVNKTSEKPGTTDETPVIQLPETTYSDMEVRNIILEYLKDSNKTVVTFDIYNTTTEKVESQHFDAILIGKNENVLGTLNTYIQSLEVGEQHSVSVVYKGDLTSTTQIKLIKK